MTLHVATEMTSACELAGITMLHTDVALYRRREKLQLSFVHAHVHARGRIVYFVPSSSWNQSRDFLHCIRCVYDYALINARARALCRTSSAGFTRKIQNTRKLTSFVSIDQFPSRYRRGRVPPVEYTSGEHLSSSTCCLTV